MRVNSPQQPASGRSQRRHLGDWGFGDVTQVHVHFSRVRSPKGDS